MSPIRAWGLFVFLTKKERKKEKQKKRDTNECRIKEENRTNLSSCTIRVCV